MAEEPIRIRDCACPGSPHSDGDFVRLRPKLTAAGGAAAIFAIAANGGNPAKATGELFEILLTAGIGWWNLVAEKGRPVSLNAQAIIEQIDWGGGGRLLFDKVTELYNAALFGEPDEPEADDDTAPLATPESSDSGPIETSPADRASTSATPPSSARRRAPSK